MPKSNTAAVVAAASLASAPVAATPPAVVFPTTDEMIKLGMTTKSARIRHLNSLGMPIGKIAKQETNGLYQHAYNVIKKPLKVAPTVAPAATVETPKAKEVTEKSAAA